MNPRSGRRFVTADGLCPDGTVRTRQDFALAVINAHE